MVRCNKCNDFHYAFECCSAEFDPSKSKCSECGETGHPWWDHVREPGYTFGEEPMEPYKDWNLDQFGDGIELTTRAQKRKIMDKHCLEPAKPRSHHGKKLFFDMG